MAKQTKKAPAKKTAVAPKKTPAKKSASPLKKVSKTTPPGGPGTRYFGEPVPDHTSNITWSPAHDKQYYNSPYYIQHEKTVQPFKASRAPGYMGLDSVLTAAQISSIVAANQISFHMNGDTGGATLSKFKTEVSIADMMASDLTAPNGPCFFFHLGDVVYNFGEENYYYDQFYDPFRTYNAPIFAIPGNHDGMIYSASMTPLAAFMANFCTTTPQTAPNAGGLLRTTMNQPGVYFTLDAPFVSIIGLYSNVIDNGPGVISTQGGMFPTITNAQLTFLNAELKRLKAKRQTDPRAVIVAVHHPPFSGDSRHGGSPLMSRDLDNAFTNAGMWPDAVISGHTHHYERFQRTVNGKQIPYIIAGSGGFNNKPLAFPPTKLPMQIPGNSQLQMINYLPDYGYLSVNVNAANKQMTISFNTTNLALGKKGRAADSVIVPW